MTYQFSPVQDFKSLSGAELLKISTLPDLAFVLQELWI